VVKCKTPIFLTKASHYLAMDVLKEHFISKSYIS